MRKISLLLSAISLSGCIAFSAAGCFHLSSGTKLKGEELMARIRENANNIYGIPLAEEWNVVYDNNQIGGLQNDGAAYFVLESEPRDEAFFNTCFSEKNEKFEEKFNEMLDGFESMSNDPVEAEYRPNFEEEYVWRLVGRDIVFGEHAQEGLFEVAENPGEWMEETFFSSFWVAYFTSEHRAYLIEDRL